jgi:hypothetical protein
MTCRPFPKTPLAVVRRSATSRAGKKRASVREGELGAITELAEEHNKQSVLSFFRHFLSSVECDRWNRTQSGVAGEIPGRNRPDPRTPRTWAGGLKKSGRDTDRALSCSS